MMENPQSKLLPDGRLWLHHGPIDLLIEAHGSPQEVELAYQAAVKKFQHLLAQIVEELPQLRTPVDQAKKSWKHEVCQSMENACFPYNDCFITPMAAVAGSVADTINGAMRFGRKLEKCYVNNGGDISVYLSPENTFSAVIAGNPENPNFAGSLRIDYASPTRGVATSGRSGRSFSLGIADSVTVLAKNAASADAATTLIANAVDVEHPAILRQKAETLDPDSDLGDKWVTVDVEDLPLPAIEEALENGIKTTRKYYQNGLIHAAYLCLQGRRRIFSPHSEKALRLSETTSF